MVAGKPAVALGALFAFGVLFQVLGCAIWQNWWPALTGILYVIAPMPYLFFGASSNTYGGGASLGWVDAGKFLTGFTAIAVFAIPSILAHAAVITPGALALELVAAVFLSAAALVYDFAATADVDF